MIQFIPVSNGPANNPRYKISTSRKRFKVGFGRRLGRGQILLQWTQEKSNSKKAANPLQFGLNRGYLDLGGGRRQKRKRHRQRSSRPVDRDGNNRRFQEKPKK